MQEKKENSVWQNAAEIAGTPTDSKYKKRRPLAMTPYTHNTSFIVHGVVIWQAGLGVTRKASTHVPIHIGVPLVTVATQMVFLKVTFFGKKGN